MRGVFFKIKEIAFVVLALGVAAALFCVTRLPAFAQGENYELHYAPSSSAQAVVSDEPFITKLLHEVKGESVRYGGDCYEELKSRYHAELLFSEEVCGVKNYYLYSPVLGSCVELGGEAVNLHIAVSREQTAVGTPLIFGGY